MVFRQETNLYDDNAIAKKFSSQDTKFEVVQGKISYLISDSEIEEYGSGKGTVTSRLNTAESNIDGNSSLISSLTTQYDTLTGEITAYESSTNEYKQTTNQTISTITQTVSTKTRTFNTQPSPPYAVNDLWLKDRDLYVCTVAKTSDQSFAETDWTLATKYTSDAALTQFIENTYASDKTTLQNQIDGKIETWNQSDDPSTAWGSTAEKGKHTGDLWYRTSDNTTWRYTGSAWVQQDVPTAVIGAINGKAVLWTTQPRPPYTTNDLWVQGSSGDIMKCVNARSSGSYVSSDWAKASKYTDDSALNTWLSGTYASDKSSLQTQIDGKIETWSQTSDPSTAWTTTALKNQHKGDLWYNTTSSVQKYFRWSGTAWVEITATPPSAIVTTINGKAQIFTGSTVPKPPYYVGDLWFNSTSDNTGDIYTCVTGKTSGTSGTASHWKIRNKYTDDSAFNTWKGNTSYTTFKSFIDQLPNQINLTVEASGKYAAKASIIAEINESTESSAVKIKADRLTLEGDTLINAVNNGTGTVSINANKVNLSGYATFTSLSTAGGTSINGSNIYGGTLTLGGNGNANGQLIIKDSSNTQIGSWNNAGISITKGSINLGSGKFVVSTAGAFSLDSDYLTISNGSILTRSSNSDSADRSSKYEKGNLYWYYKGTKIADISAQTMGSDAGTLAVHCQNALHLMGEVVPNSTYFGLVYIGNNKIILSPRAGTDSEVRIVTGGYAGNGSVKTFNVNAKTINLTTSSIIVNNENAVSGTYTFGNRSVTITRGIITSVTTI